MKLVKEQMKNDKDSPYGDRYEVIGRLLTQVTGSTTKAPIPKRKVKPIVVKQQQPSLIPAPTATPAPAMDVVEEQPPVPTVAPIVQPIATGEAPRRPVNEPMPNRESTISINELNDNDLGHFVSLDSKRKQVSSTMRRADGGLIPINTIKYEAGKSDAAKDIIHTQLKLWRNEHPNTLIITPPHLL